MKIKNKFLKISFISLAIITVIIVGIIYFHPIKFLVDKAPSLPNDPIRTTTQTANEVSVGDDGTVAYYTPDN